MATELAAMFALYHQPRPDDATFELLVTDWADVLDDLRESEFLGGMKAAKRVCRFLPVPADVLRVVEEIRRSQSVNGQAVLAIAEYPSDEDFERNRRMAKGLVDRIRGNSRVTSPVRADFAAVLHEVRQ